MTNPTTRRRVLAAEIAAFAAGSFSPSRARPVVAITTKSGRPTLDPGALAEKIGRLADVVLLEFGDASWTLSEALPTPSARRLHWWDVSGRDGRTIEFASVAVHDDFSIPT